MEVWTGKLSGTPSAGGTVFLHCLGKTGGRTSAGHVVVEGDTLQKIRDGIIESAKNYLLGGEQEVKPRGDDEMMIMTSRNDNDFVTEVTHNTSVKFVIEKL